MMKSIENDLSNNDFISERKKARFFFNLVSIVYPFIERHLFPEYVKALEKLSLPNELNVLDIATGSGILADGFFKRGHSVKGFDFSKSLLKRAKRRFPEIEFTKYDLIDLHKIPSDSFGIVSTGYFLHGISSDFRKFILSNISRISSKYVVVFDYCCDGGWFVRLIEKIEGPNYVQFMSVSREDEFAEAGLKIEKMFQTSKFGNVWLCSKI